MKNELQIRQWASALVDKVREASDEIACDYIEAALIKARKEGVEYGRLIQLPHPKAPTK